MTRSGKVLRLYHLSFPITALLGWKPRLESQLLFCVSGKTIAPLLTKSKMIDFDRFFNRPKQPRDHRKAYFMPFRVTWLILAPINFPQIMLINRLEATQRRKFVWWFHSTASKAAFPKVSDTANPVNSLKRWRSWSSVCSKVSLTMLSAALAIFALSPSQKTNRTASKGGVSPRGQTCCFCFLLTFEVRREAFDSRTTSAGLERAFSLTGHVTSGSGGQYGKAAGTNHSHAAGRSRLA